MLKGEYLKYEPTLVVWLARTTEDATQTVREGEQLDEDG